MIALICARSALAGMAGALLVSLLLAGGLAMALDYRGLTVLSGSMEPAIAAGDLVIERAAPARDLAVGDIVTFAAPDRPGVTITHRVKGLVARGGQVEVITRGDANTGSERWTIAADGRVGLVVARAPGAGRAIAWTRSPPGRLLTLGLPIAALCGWALIALWRPARAAT